MNTHRFVRKLLAATLGASLLVACAPVGDSGDNDSPTIIIPAESADETRNDNGGRSDSDSTGENEDGAGRGANARFDDSSREDGQPPDERDDDDGDSSDDGNRGADDDTRGDGDRGDDQRDPEDDPAPREDPRDPTDPVAGDCRGDDCPPAEDAPVHVVVDDDRRCLHLGEEGRFGVNVCGDWRWDPRGRRFTASGELAVVTPVGEFPLHNAELRAGTRPMYLLGSAEVPFPAIGFLEDIGLSGSAPSARVAMAPGRELGSLEINGQDVELDPDAYYMVFEYDTGFSAEINGISLSTPGGGSKLVVAPEEPLIYVGGDLAGLLAGGLIDDAAFGFSLAGRLPYASANDLYDGERWAPMQLDGHFYAQGSVQLGAYPVSVSARVIIDADADDDGQTIFEGDDRDIALGADGSVSVGYSRAGFDLSAEIGTASVVYDASQGDAGHLYFYGRSGMESLFQDTPLDFIAPDHATTEIYGLYRDTDDFVLGVVWSGRMGPFSFRDATLELGTNQVQVSATMLPPTGPVLGDQHVAFNGTVRADGGYSLTGEANVDVAGFQLAAASLTLDPRGLAVSGSAGIPQVGNIVMSGSITADGSASLSGTADIAPAGLPIAGASVSLNNRGAAISGRATIPGIGHADISGDVQRDGRFSLSGAAAASVAGFDLADARLTIDDNGATLSGRIAVPGMGDANVSGRIAGANTSLTGTADLRPGGFQMAGAAVTLGGRGVHVAGTVAIPAVGGVAVSGDVPANGQFALTGRGNLSPAGIHIAGADVTVRSNGAHVEGRAGFAGTGFDVSGEAYSDGRYRFSGSVGADAGLFGGRVTLTIENNRVTANFAGQACYPIPDPCASRERVCVPIVGCTSVCVPGVSRSCVGVSENLSSDGRFCVNLPVIGRECVDIL